MNLKLPWAQKRMFWAFEKSIFKLFPKFWVPKLKPFSGKLREGVQNYWNQTFIIRNWLKNVFAATLSSKTNVLSLLKEHFSGFCKFLSDKVKAIFSETEARGSELFQSKFGQRKLLRKWFWSYLELKKECFQRLKRSFFRFFLSFKWRSWNDFVRKWGKAFKTV